MSRRPAFLSLLVLLLPSILLAWGDKKPGEFHDATPAELAMKNVDFAPDAPAAVLERVQYEDDQNFRSIEYMRIKVFKEEGKKFGDIEIVYVPGVITIRDLQARTIAADGKVSLFKGKIFEKVIVKSGGFRVMSKTFSLPDVQPGSIIEYRYERNALSPIAALYGTHFSVQREIPIVKTSFWMRPFRQLTSFFTYRDLPNGVKPAKVDDHYELELNNIPPLESERYTPPEGELKPEVAFYYTIGGIEPEQFWTKQRESWSTSAEEYIGDRRGIKKAALEITGGAPPTDAVLRKIYTRVQQVRNLSYEPEKSEQESRKLRDNDSVDDVLRNGYGWAYQLNYLFIALARAAGFDAKVVRIAPRDERFFAKNVPLASQMDAAIAAVQVDGKLMYFDPATPYAPYGRLAWEKTYVAGLKLDKKANDKTPNEWIETPMIAPAESELKRVAEVTIDESGLAHAHATMTFSGTEALTRRIASRNDDETASKKALEDEVKGWFAHGAVVTLTKVSGLKAIEEPIVVEADLVLPDLASKVGARTIVPLSVFRGASANPFTAETRKHPIYFTHPFLVTDIVTLKLPQGTKIESVPAGAEVSAGTLKFGAKYDKDEQQVTMSRTFSVAVHFIAKENYPTLRKFFGKVAAADEEQVVLRAGAAK
jgi:hypothetical protein